MKSKLDMLKRLLAIVVLLPSLGAAVHGKGQLKLDTNVLTPGMILHLTGAKFPKNEPLDILLAGPSGRSQLKHVVADTGGSFHDFVNIPAALAPGSYRLVVLASDRDEVASADVQVTTGAVTASAPAGHQMTHPEASAVPLALPRARSPWVTGGAFAAIALALVIGAAAVLRPRTA